MEGAEPMRSLMEALMESIIDDLNEGCEGAMLIVKCNLLSSMYNYLAEVLKEPCEN